MNVWNAKDSVYFRGPLDVTRAATAVLDARGWVVGWSPAAEGMLGYRSDEIVGHSVDVLFAGGRSWQPGLAEWRDAPNVRSNAVDLKHRDGHIVRSATMMSRLSHGDEGPAWVVVAAELEEVHDWEAGQAMLRGLATQSPISLTIYDTELRLAWANTASGREFAEPVEDVVGTLSQDLYPGGEVLTEGAPSTLEQVMRDVLATGEPVVDLRYRGRPPADREQDHVWSCSYYRLQDARGQTLGVCEDAFDVTDRYLAQRRLALLVRAGSHIGTTLDVARTVTECTEVSVPGFADAVVVDLVEGVTEGEEPGPGQTRPEPLLRMARRSAGGVSEEGAPETPPAERRITYAEESPQARSLSSGLRVLEESGPDEEVPLPDAEPWAHSVLAVPLRARGTTLGLITYLRGPACARFDTDDLSLAEELAARTAVCIDNARRYTREREAALALQRDLLPRNIPPQTAVEVAHRYLPAHLAGVGGDWFDVVPLSGARVGLVVGDVVGHGLRAAATMGRLRTSVRALARLDYTPDELLTRLDDLAEQTSEEQTLARRVSGRPTEPGPDDDPALGVTCLYAVYDPVTGRCSVARAGHPPPAVVAPDGTLTYPELPSGPPLGLGGLPFESAELELPPGSLMALFTDGLVMGRDHDMELGLERLGRVLSDHEKPLEELCDQVIAELLPEGPAADDAALLLVRTHVLDTCEVAVWELPLDPAAVARARGLASRQLDSWGLADLSFTTELVVSELVTNAIHYASGPIQLRLIRDRSLLCEVSDAGHTTPHLRRATSEDEGGRGLFIVAHMVQRWGTRYSPAGKTIWTEQNLPSADAPRTY
ncbi:MULTISPECIES: ATP-binding SpoIIE family protein phosphatase [unclassified Streptomyces]|uniref:ATP-binding SpoIIE family protein phosphatase n=3 Tax=Streptomyces TaxID=1883 RepID=UPI0011CEC513|nr:MULTISPECIES: SpoIIE family protein phosphatase [unclassified Streptomyces]TXS74100.1 PAS domain S-box protein [Streptomyces sp. me109]